MRWDLDALKLIARNETVPGVALRDAIAEIEHLRTRLKAKEIIVKQKQERINFLVEKCLSENRAVWIATSERMPEDSTDVFVKVSVNFTTYRSVHIATHYDGKWHSVRYVLDDDMVTHWMPIPDLEVEK